MIWPYDENEEAHYVQGLTSYQALDLAYQVARGIADIHDVEEDGIASIGKLGRTYPLALPCGPSSDFSLSHPFIIHSTL